jgi:hypothetical protein
MEGQRKTAQDDLLKAKLIFDRVRATTRSAIFLQRNLRRSLQLHQEELARKDSGSGISTLGDEHLDRKLFKEPDLQDIKMHQSQRAMLVSIKGLQRARKHSSQWTTDVPLTKRKPLFKISINVITKIWSEEQMRIVYQSEDNEATLRGIETDSGKRFELDTEHIKIPPEKLKLRPTTEEESSWPKGFGERYTLAIDIGFKIKMHAEEVVSVMDMPWLKGFISSRWTASYSDFLRCPCSRDGVPIALFSKVNGDKRALGLNVRIGVEYTAPTESVLAHCKRGMRTSLSRQPSELKTLPGTPPSFEVTYLLFEKEFLYKDLICPYCVSFRYSKFHKLDDLLMHFRTEHPHCDTHVVEQRETADGKQLIRIATHSAKDRPSHRASQNAPDPRDISLVAPNRPFDQRAYLEGDDSWQREALGETPAKGIHSRNRTRTLERGKSDRATPVIQKQKRLYRVPKALPGVTYFRALDKRPLKEGEEVSESEDEMDMDFLRLKTEAMIINDPKMPEKAKQFLKVYNQYVRDQRLQSDRHFGEAVIHFSRDQKPWLEDQDLKGHFMERLAELLCDRIITEKVYNECVSIVSEVEITKPPINSSKLRTLLEPNFHSKSNGSVPPVGSTRNKDSPAQKDRGKAIETQPIALSYRNGDMDMKDADADDADRSKPSTLVYGRCLCGSAAIQHPKRPVVYCQSMVRAWFLTDSNLVVRRILTYIGLYPSNLPHRLRSRTVETCD